MSLSAMSTSESSPTSIADLPNELLLNILTPLPTRTLLHVSSLSRRFYSLVLRTYYTRMTIAATLGNGDRTLLLECYHPAVRLTEPPYLCGYLGTDGIEKAGQNLDLQSLDTSEGRGSNDVGYKLRELNNLFSRFRPYRRGDEESDGRKGKERATTETPITSRNLMPDRTTATPYLNPPRVYGRPPTGSSVGMGGLASTTTASHPPSATPPAAEASSSTSLLTNAKSSKPKPNPHENPFLNYPPVRQRTHLDAGELFTQLSAVTTLVKIGPKHGIFFSSVEVSDGVIRLFRNWLWEMGEEDDRKKMSGRKSIRELIQGENEEENGVNGSARAEVEWDGDGVAAAAGIGAEGGEDGKSKEDKGVLWVNTGRDVAVRFRVRRAPSLWHNPILISNDEDVAMSYEIEFEEVLVRTRHLLMVTEKSLTEQSALSGKAIVFGSWHS